MNHISEILKPILYRAGKFYHKSQFIIETNGEDLRMGKPLEHFTGVWDPGKTKLLFAKRNADNNRLITAVAVQAPHRQDVLMTGKRQSKKWELIDLPLPYVYYFIHLNTYGQTLTVQIVGIGCSLEFKDLRKDHINILPLPNTGDALYTCSMPRNCYDQVDFIKQLIPTEGPLSKAAINEAAKAAICHFWSEGFHYHEHVHNAHKLLYSWAQTSGNMPYYNIGYLMNGGDIHLPVYKAWSKLKLRDLENQAWLKSQTAKHYSIPWIQNADLTINV